MADLAALPGIEDLSLSTNATQLAPQADALRRAGLTRLNVSLDSLRPDCLAEITGSPCLDQVLDGLRAARAAGFQRIKINMMPMAGLNDRDVGEMVAFCMDQGFVLRLIEAMPMGSTGRQTRGADLQAILKELRERFALEPQALDLGGGPARYWSTPDQRFTLGLITPLSQHFCATCNRVRLAGGRHPLPLPGPGAKFSSAPPVAGRMQRPGAGGRHPPGGGSEAGKARFLRSAGQDCALHVRHRRLSREGLCPWKMPKEYKKIMGNL